jgi:cell division inhibitor SepF
MAGKVINKMMGFLGLEDDISEELEDSIQSEEIENGGDPEIEPSFSKKNNRVVSIHTTISAKVRIVKPASYEEAADIIDELKNRKIILVNTTELDLKVAQRLLDFMGGASYALSGDLQEIEKGVYILSPSNVEVNNELKNELSSKGLFNWNK